MNASERNVDDWRAETLQRGEPSHLVSSLWKAEASPHPQFVRRRVSARGPAESSTVIYGTGHSGTCSSARRCTVSRGMVRLPPKFAPGYEGHKRGSCAQQPRAQVFALR